MKKGFTLIELIGVIAVLGVIFAIAYPTFVNIISSNNEKAKQAQINEIIKESKKWSMEKMDSNLVETTPQYVTVLELYTLGYLTSSDITDPVTKKSLKDSCVKISVNDYNSYDYDFLEICNK